MLAERRVGRRAGSSAAAEYAKLTKEWRHRNRRLFRCMTGACAVVIAGTLLLGASEILGWMCGLLAGVALCFLIVARETPPPWIGQYLTGAAGEERTAKVLEPLLRDGWFIAHDIDRGRFNIDHLLVGSGGVFVLETKNLHGQVAVDGDWATLTRPGRERPEYRGNWWAREARSHAADANKFFRQRADVRPWVTAVVVLWADFPPGVAAGDRMTYVQADHLITWLRAQPHRLTPDHIHKLRTALTPQHRHQPAPALPTT